MTGEPKFQPTRILALAHHEYYDVMKIARMITVYRLDVTIYLLGQRYSKPVSCKILTMLDAAFIEFKYFLLESCAYFSAQNEKQMNESLCQL